MIRRRRHEAGRVGNRHVHGPDSFPSLSGFAHPHIPFYVRGSERWPNLLPAYQKMFIDSKRTLFIIKSNGEPISGLPTFWCPQVER
jgi:hypothetical protein